MTSPGKAMTAARAGFGLLELAAPGLVARRLSGQRPDSRVAMVARVLGARHLAQACLSGPAPTAAVLALEAEVDAVHAVSMIGVAVLSRRWRPAALASAAVAAGFAAAGGLAARAALRHPAGPAGRGAIVRLRDEWADGLAQHLGPWNGPAEARRTTLEARATRATSRPAAGSREGGTADGDRNGR